MSLDILPVFPQGRQLIQSYGDGRFSISEKKYDHPLLVFPQYTVPWLPIDEKNLRLDDFEKVLSAEPAVDTLLLGCGKVTMFIPLLLRDALKDRGVVLEPMDTGAACRTFNVLLGEDRRIAAAVMQVD